MNNLYPNQGKYYYFIIILISVKVWKVKIYLYCYCIIFVSLKISISMMVIAFRWTFIISHDPLLISICFYLSFYILTWRTHSRLNEGWKYINNKSWDQMISMMKRRGKNDDEEKSNWNDEKEMMREEEDKLFILKV